jgi:hypothetical protein
MNSFRQSVLVAALLVAVALARAQTPDRTGPAFWLGSLGLNAAATATWVDNLSRTSYAPTRKDAMTYDFSLEASRHQQLAPSWLLHFGATAEYHAVPEYDLTSNATLGARAGLQEKFGLGPLAPVLQFDAGYTYKAARLAGDRGRTAEASLRLSKRLNEILKVSAVGQWLQHDAASPIFDIQQRSWSVEAAWDINDRWRLTGSAGRLQGTIVANAAWNIWGMAIGGGFGPAVANYYNSIPWGVTNLYGPGWVSYRVQADVDLWSLTLACAVTEPLSLELRYNSAFVVNQVGIRYPTESWGLGLNYRF